MCHRLKQGFRDQIQRAHAGDDPQELADVADAAPPQPDDGPGIGAGDVHILPAAADPDGAARGEVVAVEGAQERGLARAGRPVQGDALARVHGKADPGKGLDRHPALLVQHEGLAQVSDFNDGSVHGLPLQDGRDEELRVGVMRIVEHLIGEPRFHDLPPVHDHEPVREQAGHGEIVGDEDDPQIHVQHKMALPRSVP